MCSLSVVDEFDWSCWVFSCLFDSGGVERVVVYASCEYDAWVSFRVLTGLRVDLDGLEGSIRDEAC